MIEKENKTFKILSIDGGGIKGLYSSTIIEHLENKYNCCMSDHFDMLCGTSTGGLIALGLSLKMPAKEISQMYINQGIQIFPKTGKVKGYIKQALIKGKFSAKPLKNILEDLFGERKIKESNNLLCIPSFCLTKGEPWVFKYDHTVLERDNEALYVDVALATSAAPTYFPSHEIEHYSRKQFIDGGVWANNPTLVGLLEALKYFVGEGKEYSDIKILSISSLNKTNGHRIGERVEKSFWHWKNDLFDTFISGQSFFTDFFMKNISFSNNVPIDYVRIPTTEISSKHEPLVQMDLATKDAIDLIKSMGDDQAVIYSKLSEVESFFKEKKTYKN